MTQANLAPFGAQPLYRCLSLDPPWLERGGGKSCRGAQRHYPLMATAAIVELVRGSEPIARLAPSAHCWCWVTDNFLEDGLELMRALGFRYKRTLVWVKVKRAHGLATWMRWLVTELVSAANAIDEIRDAAPAARRDLTLRIGFVLVGPERQTNEASHSETHRRTMTPIS